MFPPLASAQSTKEKREKLILLLDSVLKIKYSEYVKIVPTTYMHQ